jgi:DNA polymerase I-like protein with 3'-5' exonuclease and polymerase domains
MTMGSLLDENREAGLKTYAEEHGYPRYWEAVEKYWKRRPREDPPPEVLHSYNAHDVGLSDVLQLEFFELLKENPKLEKYYLDFIRPCLRLAAELHLAGIKTEESLTLEAPRMRRRIAYRANRLFDIAGVPNDNKYRNLKLLRNKEWLHRFLFSSGGLNLKVERRFRTKVKKDPQVTREHLEYLLERDESGAVQILYDLSFKQKEYTDLKKMLPWAGGMVYPSYNVGGTGERDEESRPVRTGRWSARDPNVQQFAPYLKRHVGSRYSDGWIAQWDGNQIEARVAPVYSRDPRLIQVFQDGRDPYLECATVLFGKDKALPRRFMGKRAHLAELFGVGARKLRKELNKDLADRKFKERVTDGDCEDFLAKLRSEHRIHFEWIGDTRATVRRTGYVESLTGRRRRLPHAYAGDAHALNQAINFPIQSLANDLNLLSAVLAGWRFSGGVLATLVHDSGVADCKSLEVVGRFAQRIRRVWRDLPTEKYFGFTSPVPLTVTLSAGRRWHPMKKFEEVSEMEETDGK